MSFAHHSTSAETFKALLLTGRFISGIGMGWASAVVSVSRPSSLTDRTSIFACLFIYTRVYTWFKRKNEDISLCVLTN